MHTLSVRAPPDLSVVVQVGKENKQKQDRNGSMVLTLQRTHMPAM